MLRPPALEGPFEVALELPEPEVLEGTVVEAGRAAPGWVVFEAAPPALEAWPVRAADEPPSRPPLWPWREAPVDLAGVDWRTTV
jgi:hypothetical protein